MLANDIVLILSMNSAKQTMILRYFGDTTVIAHY